MGAPTEGAVLAGPPSAVSTTAPAPQRSPPKAFCVLLPVWGESYVTRFLESSLLTLLAQGNIPALAAALPTRFVFLCKAADEQMIIAHPAHALLSAFCTVEFLPIDDLIMSGNHSTTITLAYERAMRRQEAAMLDTCFIYLVSDYLMADGSLSAVAERMLAGYSGIQVGNFQLNEEVADPWLRERLDSAGTSLTLDAREMVRWGLDSLHPTAIANMVNYPLCHNSHTNRLFWRVDADTMIGRFYLLHMICIRPERRDFKIGSSCDYSFIPEMCPSGNVTIIADSDDYFVAEVQPFGHEHHFIRFGPVETGVLAESLSEWTTARHRLNAQQAIVFHAGDCSPLLSEALAEADRFIRDVTPRLGPPQPYRNHPYWIGAIAALEAAAATRTTEVVEATVPATVQLKQWAHAALVGYFPRIKRMHPRWRDYKILSAACEHLIASPSPRLLVCPGQLEAVANFLKGRAETVPFSLRNMLLGRPLAGTDDGGFDGAFAEISGADLGYLDQFLRPLAALLRPGAPIILATINTETAGDPQSIGRGYAVHAASLLFAGVVPKECQISHMSWWRWRANRACVSAANDLVMRPWRFFPLSAVRMVFWGIPALFANVLSSYRQERYLSHRGVVSGVAIRFSVEPATE